MRLSKVTFNRMLIRMVVASTLLGLTACQQCVTTDCGSGRSATYCTKQGRACAECRNHKLVDENDKTLFGCEDGYERGQIVDCTPFAQRGIRDYCAEGKVCIGLNGACKSNSDCCTGFCGDASKRCFVP